MQLIVPHSGRPLMLLVTLVQVLPPSDDTLTRPSSVPAQSRSFCRGDSAMAKMVPYTSTPVLSPVIGPPDHCCLVLSLRVRSPLIAAHFRPASLVMNNTLAA